MNHPRTTARLALATAAIGALLIGCAADAEPEIQTPEADVATTQEELRIGVGIERTCPDFMMWCTACGTCMDTDKVCNSDFCPDRDSTRTPNRLKDR